MGALGWIILVLVVLVLAAVARASYRSDAANR